MAAPNHEQAPPAAGTVEEDDRPLRVLVQTKRISSQGTRIPRVGHVSMLWKT